jgi:hypothetical protein
MGKLRILFVLGSCLMLPALSGLAIPQDQSIEMLTSDRMVSKGWWPTKGSAERSEFVGPAACAGCHREKFRTQQSTPMAQTAMAPAESQSLISSPKLSSQIGNLRYELVLGKDGVSYSVTKGTASVSQRLEWVFGSGKDGQTYVYSRNGQFYESQVSYYPTIQTLDITPGHSHAEPSKLEDALGEALDPKAASACFSCHTTASTTRFRFDPERSIPGVTCEACHGPGSRHVAAMNLDPQGGSAKFTLNPAALSPIDSVEFCGACHRARWDVVASGHVGPDDVRFQAYRLETSKCFGNGTQRITCITCHDPHVPPVREAAFYDKVCLTCHAAKSAAKGEPAHVRRACPVRDKDCVTCHMPRIELAGKHSSFADHRIRIVKSGAPVPE